MKVLGYEGWIYLDSDELATAIDAYLAAHRVNVTGPRSMNIIGKSDAGPTVIVSSANIDYVRIYVDPSGKLVDNR